MADMSKKCQSGSEGPIPAQKVACCPARGDKQANSGMKGKNELTSCDGNNDMNCAVAEKIVSIYECGAMKDACGAVLKCPIPAPKAEVLVACCSDRGGKQANSSMEGKNELTSCDGNNDMSCVEKIVSTYECGAMKDACGAVKCECAPCHCMDGCGSKKSGGETRRM